MKTQVKSHARKGTRGVRAHSRNVKKVPHNTSASAANANCFAKYVFIRGCG